jgi:hypothetical protein
MKDKVARAMIEALTNQLGYYYDENTQTLKGYGLGAIVRDRLLKETIERQELLAEHLKVEFEQDAPVAARWRLREVKEKGK